MKKTLRKIVIFLLTIPMWGGPGWSFISSCAPSLPSDVIPENEMTNILYDYHIATSMVQQDGKLKAENLYADILKKYGITQAEFDSSMVYYTRHYSLLNNIYANVEERLMQQTVAMGGSVQDINSMGESFSSADTTNVWPSEVSLLMLPYSPYHTRQFDIKADTTYKAGDKMLLSFDAEFLMQDGSRDLIAMLATRLKTDSVIYSTQHISYPTHGSLTVSDTEREGIKSVSCFFTLKTDNNDATQTAKVALVRNLKLIRMHTVDPNAAAEEADSLATDSAGTLRVKKETRIQTTGNQQDGLQETSLDSASRTTDNTVR